MAQVLKPQSPDPWQSTAFQIFPTRVILQEDLFRISRWERLFPQWTRAWPLFSAWRAFSNLTLDSTSVALAVGITLVGFGLRSLGGIMNGGRHFCRYRFRRRIRICPDLFRKNLVSVRATQPFTRRVFDFPLSLRSHSKIASSFSVWKMPKRALGVIILRRSGKSSKQPNHLRTLPVFCFDFSLFPLGFF